MKKPGAIRVTAPTNYLVILSRSWGYLIVGVSVLTAIHHFSGWNVDAMTKRIQVNCVAKVVG